MSADQTLPALSTAQGAAILVLIVLATVFAAPWIPRERGVIWALSVGPLAVAATALFMLAVQASYLAVASVISLLYPAVTVVLALIVLGDRLRGLQWFGLVLSAIAIVCVAGG